MNLHDLETFVSIARLGGVTRAAGFGADEKAIIHMRHKPAHVGCDKIFLDLPVHTSCTRGLLTN
jgi:hypothetical protein